MSNTIMKKTKGITLAAIITACPLVAYFEGYMPKTYSDPVGIPTVCYGETDKDVINLKQVFTQQECTAALGASLAIHAAAVSKCITQPIEVRQAAAVLSWSYNVGSGAACSSTLMQKLNSNKEFCSELKRWVFAKGVQLPGLVKRRDAEFKMCTTGAWR